MYDSMYDAGAQHGFKYDSKVRFQVRVRSEVRFHVGAGAKYASMYGSIPFTTGVYIV